MARGGGGPSRGDAVSRVPWDPPRPGDIVTPNGAAPSPTLSMWPDEDCRPRAGGGHRPIELHRGARALVLRVTPHAGPVAAQVYAPGHGVGWVWLAFLDAVVSP